MKKNQISYGRRGVKTLEADFWDEVVLKKERHASIFNSPSSDSFDSKALKKTKKVSKKTSKLAKKTVYSDSSSPFSSPFSSPKLFKDSHKVESPKKTDNNLIRPQRNVKKICYADSSNSFTRLPKPARKTRPKKENKTTCKIGKNKEVPEETVEKEVINLPSDIENYSLVISDGSNSFQDKINNVKMLMDSDGENHSRNTTSYSTSTPNFTDQLRKRLLRRRAMTPLNLDVSSRNNCSNLTGQLKVMTEDKYCESFKSSDEENHGSHYPLSPIPIDNSSVDENHSVQESLELFSESALNDQPTTGESNNSQQASLELFSYHPSFSHPAIQEEIEGEGDVSNPSHSSHSRGYHTAKTHMSGLSQLSTESSPMLNNQNKENLSTISSELSNLSIKSTPFKSPPQFNDHTFSKALTPYSKSKKIEHPKEKLLALCGQECLISFEEAIPTEMMDDCIKIGEGVFGEVFKTQRNQEGVAIKIVPIEGKLLVNDEPQKTYPEVLTEVVIAQELSRLSRGKIQRTPNFVQVNDISVVQGKYPSKLLEEWDSFHQRKTSENDRPDFFPDDQLFIVFEFMNAGSSLEDYQLSSLEAAHSVLKQVAAALAVAEEALHFEHRDLHWGNVLIKETEDFAITCNLNGNPIVIETHGVIATIIDFTLSRVTKDGLNVFCDLSSDEDLFKGEGDYQFEVYRLMRKENNNKWSTYCPHSNVLWLKYLADKLLHEVKYSKNSQKRKNQYQKERRQLRYFHQTVLDHPSASDVLLTNSYILK